MLKPEEVKEEQARLKLLIEIAIRQTNQAKNSKFWSYTREYQAGELAAAEMILRDVHNSL